MPLYRARQRCFVRELREPGEVFEHEFTGHLIPPHYVEPVATEEPPARAASNDKKPS